MRRGGRRQRVTADRPVAVGREEFFRPAGPGRGGGMVRAAGLRPPSGCRQPGVRGRVVRRRHQPERGGDGRVAPRRTACGRTGWPPARRTAQWRTPPRNRLGERRCRRSGSRRRGRSEGAGARKGPCRYRTGNEQDSPRQPDPTLGMCHSSSLDLTIARVRRPRSAEGQSPRANAVPAPLAPGETRYKLHAHVWLRRLSAGAQGKPRPLTRGRLQEIAGQLARR